MKAMILIQNKNFMAHFFALQIGVVILITPVALGSPSNWDPFLLFACGVLGLVCYFKSLPYSRWLAGKIIELVERL